VGAKVHLDSLVTYSRFAIHERSGRRASSSSSKWQRSLRPDRIDLVRKIVDNAMLAVPTN